MKPHFINLNKSQNERLISLLEIGTTEARNQIQNFEVREIEFKGTFKEFENKYLKDREVLEGLKKTIADDEGSIKLLKGMLTNTSPENVRHILRPTSHLDEVHKKEKRKFRQRILWGLLTKETLLKANRFLTQDQIIDTLISTNSEVAKLYERKGRGYLKSNWQVSVLAIINKGGKSQNGIIIYKEKIGLQEWTQNDIPKAEFMTAFVFANESEYKKVI